MACGFLKYLLLYRKRVAREAEFSNQDIRIFSRQPFSRQPVNHRYVAYSPDLFSQMLARAHYHFRRYLQNRTPLASPLI